MRLAAPDPDGVRGLVDQDLRLAEWAHDPEVEAKGGFPIPHEGGDVAPNILRARRQLLIVRGAAKRFRALASRIVGMNPHWEKSWPNRGLLRNSSLN